MEAARVSARPAPRLQVEPRPAHQEVVRDEDAAHLDTSDCCRHFGSLGDKHALNTGDLRQARTAQHAACGKLGDKATTDD